MSAPTASRLASSDIVDFLVAQGMAVAPKAANPKGLPVAAGFEGKLPALPDRMYIIAATGGPGFMVERGIDVQSFQIRTRGKGAIGGRAQDATDDAEQLAWDVDGMLMGLTAGIVGSAYVNLVDRVGSPPTFLLRDSKGRVHLTGNYLFHVARVSA